MENLSPIKKRVLEVMNEWENERLRSELAVYIEADADEELSNMFFDDIATEEEHEVGKLSI